MGIADIVVTVGFYILVLFYVMVFVLEGRRRAIERRKRAETYHLLWGVKKH